MALIWWIGSAPIVSLDLLQGHSLEHYILLWGLEPLVVSQQGSVQRQISSYTSEG